MQFYNNKYIILAQISIAASVCVCVCIWGTERESNHGDRVSMSIPGPSEMLAGVHCNVKCL